MPKYFNNMMVFEARFNNSLLFNDFNILQNISNKLNKYFPLSNYDTTKKILVLNQTNSKNGLQIGSNRIALTMNEPDLMGDILELYNNINNIVIEELKIISFQRVGLRSLRGIKFNNMGECNNYIKNNFLKLNYKALSSIGETVQECMVSMKFDINNYKVMVNIRPNLFQIMELENNKIKRNEKMEQVLIDSDVFKEGNCNASIANEFIQNAIDINKINIENFIKEMSVY